MYKTETLRYKTIFFKAPIKSMEDDSLYILPICIVGWHIKGPRGADYFWGPLTDECYTLLVQV